MACIFGFFMGNHEFWYLDKKLGQVLGPQMVKEHAKNDLTAPILTQEAILGECTFGGANGHQIGKFHLGWKVDRQGFLERQPKLNLDFRNCLKISRKVAWLI